MLCTARNLDEWPRVDVCALNALVRPRVRTPRPARLQGRQQGRQHLSNTGLPCGSHSPGQPAPSDVDDEVLDPSRLGDTSLPPTSTLASTSLRLPADSLLLVRAEGNWEPSALHATDLATNTAGSLLAAWWW
mmetsp:Transcript_43097/g.115215  ORF Transcript_43097/g.115215 Transcript_43097/m.115215 type:complete len:132 (-) Transcript_43097:1682-2077(-)